jgi:hypothetical protein
MTSQAELCNICCEGFNKSSRIKICCNYCDFPACKTCCETYLLSETIHKCMNTPCGKEWTRKFIREKFTASFISTKLNKHIEQILFEQEKALLPATQLIVKEKMRKDKVRKEINELDKLITDLRSERMNLEFKFTNGGESKFNSKQIQTFIRQCPANDCRGFLSTQWKCGICQIWACPDCHEVKGLNRDCDHVCDPNSVQTAKLLSSDSKPCPKCQSLIFKISGCDQMWCTQCHTGFSWKTSIIETKLHNPHYYEWQRVNGHLERNEGDIECGREINNQTISIIRSLISKRLYIQKNKGVNIISIIRNTIHNVEVELPRYQTNHVNKNQDIRVRYLCNEINEDYFKTLLQRNDKKYKKYEEISQIIQLSNTTITDIVFRIMDLLRKTDADYTDSFNALLGEFNEIINYCNDLFKDVAFTYNSRQYYFDEQFNICVMGKSGIKSDDL